tara:strand:- start:544 stop:723 length:180 start_codon:yes stop_codon:yes gene_type:complete
MQDRNKKTKYGTMGPGLEKEYAGIPFKNAVIKRIMLNNPVAGEGKFGTIIKRMKPKVKA